MAVLHFLAVVIPSAAESSKNGYHVAHVLLYLGHHLMKPSTRMFSLTLGAIAVFAPSLALAHPGHDGDHGGLSWDFTADLVHYLTSPYHLLPAAAAGIVATLAWRYFRSNRKETKR
jgi:hydrogenase/urease accessory protein HupE